MFRLFSLKLIFFKLPLHLQVGGVLESSGDPLDDGYENFKIDAS